MTLSEEQHLLVCLAEECAEVQHAMMKMFRFGKVDGYAERVTTNFEDLQNEAWDLRAVLLLLEDRGILKAPPLDAIRKKWAKIEHYVEYAKRGGTIREPSP